LNAKLDPAAVPSAPTIFTAQFFGPYLNALGANNGPQMSFGICYALGCNYRNATVYNMGVSADKQVAVFNITFYTLPGANASVLPALLAAALPSLNVSAVGTIAYGMAFSQGGALSLLSGVVRGYGSLSPPSPPLPPAPLVSSWACTCLGGYSGADCKTPPAHNPPPPRPIAQWTKVDNGEVIALDIPYGLYASQQAFYREAFIAAVASVQHALPISVFVTDFQASISGGTLIYFDTVLDGTDYDVMSVAAVVALFNTSSPACAATTPVGCPAYANLTAALISNGLPVAGAFYNNQFGVGAYVPVSAAASINASQVGTWRYADNGEALVVDILYSSYASNQQCVLCAASRVRCSPPPPQVLQGGDHRWRCDCDGLADHRGVRRELHAYRRRHDDCPPGHYIASHLLICHPGRLCSVRGTVHALQRRGGEPRGLPRRSRVDACHCSQTVRPSHF